MFACQGFFVSFSSPTYLASKRALLIACFELVETNRPVIHFLPIHTFAVVICFCTVTYIYLYIFNQLLFNNVFVFSVPSYVFFPQLNVKNRNSTKFGLSIEEVKYLFKNFVYSGEEWVIWYICVYPS